MNLNDHQQLFDKLEEDGLMKVRRDFEAGEYGKNNASIEYKLVEAWLESQHRQRAEDFHDLPKSPVRLALVVLFSLLFVAYLVYLFFD